MLISLKILVTPEKILGVTKKNLKMHFLVGIIEFSLVTPNYKLGVTTVN